jgi:hypothetical protein
MSFIESHSPLSQPFSPKRSKAGQHFGGVNTKPAAMRLTGLAPTKLIAVSHDSMHLTCNFPRVVVIRAMAHAHDLGLTDPDWPNPQYDILVHRPLISDLLLIFRMGASRSHEEDANTCNPRRFPSDAIQHPRTASFEKRDAHDHLSERTQNCDNAPRYAMPCQIANYMPCPSLALAQSLSNPGQPPSGSSHILISCTTKS